MAQSFSTHDRSKYHRESPLFWLYLIAASLILHLVILLIGRWYLTQTSSLQTAGRSPGSVEFVEIDPNVSVSQPLKSVSPSAPKTAPLPQAAAPPANNSSEESQSPLSTSILKTPTQPTNSNAPRPSAPPSSPSTSSHPSPSSSPSPSSPPSPKFNPPQQANPSLPPRNSPQPAKPDVTDKQPKDSPPPNSGSASPKPESSPGSQGGSPSAPQTPDSSSQPPGGVKPGSPDSSSNNSQGNPPSNGTQNSGSSSEPSRSGTSLKGYSNLGIQLTSKLEIPASARNQTSAKAAKLISPIDINLAYPVKLPTQVLDLRISLVIDNESGSVLGLKVLDDSPTLKTYPDIDKGLIEGAVAQAFYDQAKFQVDVETNQGNKAPASDWETSIRVQLSP